VALQKLDGDKVSDNRREALKMTRLLTVALSHTNQHGRLKNGGDGRNTLTILSLKNALLSLRTALLSLRTALQRARKCCTTGQLVR
jgi:hypothetical protein